MQGCIRRREKAKRPDAPLVLVLVLDAAVAACGV
jgi:hypothetical protein